MTRRFYVRTYGCQMNEHDSERIAGLLAADGMEPTDDLDDGRRRRAQHLLHPRERRQQALRAPRPAEGAEGRPARSADRGRRVPGPEGPRADRRAAPVTSTWCSAPTTSPTRRVAARAGPRRGPGGRDPRGARGVPVGAAGPARRRRHSAWVTIQIGCDNSCAFCIVPVGARPRDQPAAWATSCARSRSSPPTACARSPLLGQNVNSYGRDLGAGQYRPQFADLLRAARRGRRHRAHPLHVARTRRTCGPRRSRPWPSARRCASTCTCRCSRAATARWRACTAATPPSATSTAWPRPGPPSPTSRSPPTSSSASPARPTPTSCARSRWSTPPSTTPPTRSCSRPGPAPRRPT